MTEEMGSGRVRVDTVDAQWVCWVSEVFHVVCSRGKYHRRPSWKLDESRASRSAIRKMGNSGGGKVRRDAGTWGWW
jgi:hypothetical protein